MKYYIFGIFQFLLDTSTLGENGIMYCTPFISNSPQVMCVFNFDHALQYLFYRAFMLS